MIYYIYVICPCIKLYYNCLKYFLPKCLVYFKSIYKKLHSEYFLLIIVKYLPIFFFKYIILIINEYIENNIIFKFFVGNN